MNSTFWVWHDYNTLRSILGLNISIKYDHDVLINKLLRVGERIMRSNSFLRNYTAKIDVKERDIVYLAL